MTDRMQDAWTIPDTLYIYDFEQKAFSIEWAGTGTLSSPECKIYLNGADVTSTYMPTGSDTVSGRIQTSKTCTSLIGGETYVLRWKITEGGYVRGIQTMLECLESGQLR